MTVQYPTILNYSHNSSGAMPLLYSIRDSIPYAFEGMLIAIYFVLVAGGYFMIKNKFGRGKILTYLVSSSIIMIILSILLAMAQLVTFMTVLFFAFCSIVFFILYLVSDFW